MTVISTPLHIEVLIHCYVSGTAHPRFSAPAVQSAINELLDEKAIEWNAESKDTHAYQTTEKGHAWVKAICNTPPPVQCWKDGATGELIELP